MAFTATLRRSTVFGDQRVLQYKVVADAASGQVATGLQYIDCIATSIESAATGGFKVRPNLSEASAASNGVVFVSSAANGDIFFLTIFGR